MRLKNLHISFLVNRINWANKWNNENIVIAAYTAILPQNSKNIAYCNFIALAFFGKNDILEQNGNAVYTIKQEDIFVQLKSNKTLEVPALEIFLTGLKFKEVNSQKINISYTPFRVYTHNEKWIDFGTNCNAKDFDIIIKKIYKNGVLFLENVRIPIAKDKNKNTFTGVSAFNP